jgi:serine/threonine protein kinase
MAEREDDAEYSARLGKTLGGKWKLDRLIGVGGMAAVYAASHRNGAQAAIKILHAHYARRPDARTRFLREAYIANKVGKGAVGVIDDDVDDDGSPYLVMDLLHGEPIDTRIQRLGGKLPMVEVLWIATQVLTTLERAHEHGIIHRDLKPDNLFWTTDQALKVLDFGVARLRDGNTTETTRTGTVVGTPAFMAPEQALGSTSEIDARTDIWSLGAIMFRLLTGRTVHVAAQSNALVAAATKRAPPILNVDTAIPAEVAVIIDTALQFEREKRYPSASAMRMAIEKVEGAVMVTRKARFTVPRVSRLMPEVDDPGAPAADARPATDRAVPAHPASRQQLASSRAAPPASADKPEADRGFATGMSDDDSLALQDLLRLIGEAVVARVENGPAHPRTIRKVDVAYRRAATALVDAHIGLFWNVVPEGFVARGQLVWQALPPLPATPQRMHDDGVRMLGLLPGLLKTELEELVRIIGGELAPFSDYATLLHSAEHPHLVHRIDATGATEQDSISLEPSSGGGVKSMLEALRASDGGALRVTLLSRLERWGEGYEDEIGEVLETTQVELAMGLLRVLHVIDTETARSAIERALKSPHAIVRVVALTYLDAPERLRVELRAALEASDPVVRFDILVGIERYKVMAAGPALALRVRAPTFDTLSVEERRQALSTLGALMPSRAETIAIELLGDERLLAQHDHEATREAAAELLGTIGEALEAREALEAATRKRWRGNDRLRTAATVALAAFDARARLVASRT